MELHFVKQINMTEQQLLLNFKKARLTPNELGKINTIATGIFDVATMTKLIPHQVRSVAGVLRARRYG